MCRNQPRAFASATSGLFHSTMASLLVGASLLSTIARGSKTSAVFSRDYSAGSPIPRRLSIAFLALRSSFMAVLTSGRFSPLAARFWATVHWSWTTSRLRWRFAARAARTVASCVASRLSGPQRNKTLRVFPCSQHLASWSCATMPTRNFAESPNKTDAGNGSYGICRVIDACRSPSPDPRRSPEI